MVTCKCNVVAFMALMFCYHSWCFICQFDKVRMYNIQHTRYIQQQSLYSIQIKKLYSFKSTAFQMKDSLCNLSVTQLHIFFLFEHNDVCYQCFEYTEINTKGCERKPSMANIIKATFRQSKNYKTDKPVGASNAVMIQ